MNKSVPDNGDSSDPDPTFPFYINPDPDPTV